MSTSCSMSSASFPWYNVAHPHSGLGLLTPHDVHSSLAEHRVAARATVLAAAYGAHPERFPAGLPQPPARPTEVWINPTATGSTEIAPGQLSGPALCSGVSVNEPEGEHDGFPARPHHHLDAWPLRRGARRRGTVGGEDHVT